MSVYYSKAVAFSTVNSVLAAFVSSTAFAGVLTGHRISRGFLFMVSNFTAPSVTVIYVGQIKLYGGQRAVCYLNDYLRDLIPICHQRN